MRARLNNEFLLGVKVGEVRGYFHIVRQQPIDLSEHRDRLKRKVLLSIMFGNAPKTGNGRRVIADPHVKISDNIQRGEVVGLFLNNFAVFLNCRWNFPNFQELLSSAQSLYLIKRHVLRSRSVNIMAMTIAIAIEDAVASPFEPPLEPSGHL